MRQPTIHQMRAKKKSSRKSQGSRNVTVPNNSFENKLHTIDVLTDSTVCVSTIFQLVLTNLLPNLRLILLIFF
jgi:hypothetical protein